MSNFGVTTLRLVNPYEIAFKEARSAVRSQYILERSEVFDSVAAAVADADLVVGTTALGNRDLHVPLYRLEAAGRLIRELLSAGPVALLFGSEKFGLSNDDMSHCHWLMRIPTRDEHASMNLGQAVAVCLYEIVRSPAAAKAAPETRREARAGDLERITAMLGESLAQSGYVHERVEGSTELKLRRLIRR